MSEDALENIINVFKEKLALDCTDKILEVGCGSGMILEPLSKQVSSVAGVDFASSLIAKIQQIIPNGEFHIAEANSLPFDSCTFDKILSFSVFQYFPDFGYAQDVLNEMVRCIKNKGRICICDIPDLARKQLSEETRTQNAAHKDFKDDGLRHLYYPQVFFSSFFKDLDYKSEVFDNVVNGYINSNFRFNVVAYVQK